MRSAATFRNAMEAVRHIGDVDPPWADILSTAKTLIGADAVTFIMMEGGTEKLSFLRQTGVDTTAEQEYRERYYQHDVIAHACAGSPAGTWWDSHELERLPGADRLPFFADFMPRHRARQVASFVILAEPTRRAGIGFQRTTPKDDVRERFARGPVKTYTNALMNALARRATRVDTDLARIEAAFAGFGDAVLLVAPTGRLMRSSPGSLALLAEAHLLPATTDMLTHERTDVRLGLFDALRHALTATRAVTFNAPTGWGTGLQLEITIAPPEYRFAQESLLLVRARKISAFDVPGTAELGAFFGLSVGEAKVLASLIEGRSPKEIALAGHVAESTVRNQIASLMQKMCCNRQTELVRLGSLLR